MVNPSEIRITGLHFLLNGLLRVTIVSSVLWWYDKILLAGLVFAGWLVYASYFHRSAILRDDCVEVTSALRRRVDILCKDVISLKWNGRVQTMASSVVLTYVRPDKLNGRIILRCNRMEWDSIVEWMRMRSRALIVVDR